MLGYLRYKQLNWYGYARRTNEERVPRKYLDWCTPERKRRRKGKPRNSWMQVVGLTTGMIKKGINSMEWITREERIKKKIKSLSTERCENIDTMHIDKKFTTVYKPRYHYHYYILR